MRCECANIDKLFTIGEVEDVAEVVRRKYGSAPREWDKLGETLLASATKFFSFD
jgi:hypothetical protein